MELPGRRQRGDSLVLVRENMQIVVMREDDAEDRERWRRLIQCGDS